MFQKKFVVFLMVILIIISSGCYGKYELNDTGIVIAMGIDKNDKGEVVLTAIATHAIGKEGANTRSPSWIGVSKGASVMEAAKNMNRIAVKKLLWFHNDLILIGEKMAKNGIMEVMDFIARNRENRFTSKILICRGSAQKILQIPSGILNDLSSEIKGLIDNSKQWSQTYVSDVREILLPLSNSKKNVGSYTGQIGYDQTMRDTFSTNREMYLKLDLIDQPTNIMYLEGVAVLKGDKLVGWLSGTETRGLLFLENKVETDTIAITEGGQGNFSVDIEKSSCELKPQLKEDRISFNVEVKVDTRIVQSEYTKTEEEMKAMEKLLTEEVTKEIKNTIHKCQKELKTDVFGLSGIIMRKDPKYWKKIEKDWDEIFTKIEFKYSVEVNIVRNGMTNETMY